jgi:predicted DNA-binding transcriptional regulator AlpA
LGVDDGPPSFLRYIIPVQRSKENNMESDEEIIELSFLCRRYGRSRKNVIKWVKDGNFPPPLDRKGKCHGYRWKWGDVLKAEEIALTSKKAAGFPGICKEKPWMERECAKVNCMFCKHWDRNNKHPLVNLAPCSHPERPAYISPLVSFRHTCQKFEQG